MDAEVKRWGNSFAIRLPKKELERLGLHEGDQVEVELRKAPRRRRKKVSLAGLPVFSSGTRDTSERHDEYLYGGKK